MIYNESNVMYVKDSGEDAYAFSLQKGEMKTFMYGQSWERFLDDYNMQAGEVILFEMTNNAAFPMKVTACDKECVHKNRVIAEEDNEGDDDISTDSESSVDLEDGIDSWTQLSYSIIYVYICILLLLLLSIL